MSFESHVIDEPSAYGLDPAINYRLAPETRFPGPLHDCVSAYLRLVDDLHIPPENIIIAGDSAGGGLSLALLMYLRDNGYPLPSAAILFSPWVGELSSQEITSFLVRAYNFASLRSYHELRLLGQQR